MTIPLLRTSRSIALAMVLLAGMAACGSDDEPDGTPVAGEPAPEATAGEVDDAADGGAAPAPGGSGTATLTMADGTVYGFAMSICETSNTDEFVIHDSYDLAGITDDGAFRFVLTRAGLDESFITQVGTLEGDFDENGSNAGILYRADLGTEPLTVDGANVSGEFVMRAILPTQPHGDQVSAILDARC